VFSGESFIAKSTHKSMGDCTVSRMSAHVYAQVGTLEKSVITYHTKESFDTGVSSLMAIQVALLLELFAAINASISLKATFFRCCTFSLD